VFNAGILMQAFVVSVDNLATTLVIVAICYLLLSRLWADWRHKEELNTEFEAAREMQQALVQRLPDAPGFTVDAAYWPASQVGGDFYRVFPATDGSILVVVGDVSGKGLKAAMTVSVLVGAMESIGTRSPGPFLTTLNRAAAAHLQFGFVTCCAALLTPGGSAAVANAGHLPPYLDGRELEVEAGLPLGLAPDVCYAETTTRGDRFTFVSDGVVEAENAQRELFGFDRTREISTKSAQTIAEAARAWGQNDDITVVTVRRTA
jgi:serine phosphatase RsbU (regulator of sigma subunit)